MLIGVGRRRYQPESARDSIHNYYEQMVIEHLLRSSDRASSDHEFMADVACVALNRLPPRYVRHDVDMTFFLSPEDIDNMEAAVVDAVNYAIEYVTSREPTDEEDSDTAH